MALMDVRTSMWLLFAGALAVRVLFYFYGTTVYYGSSGYQLGGDFGAWSQSIQNLVEHGRYTSSLGHPEGPFFRPPGYGFFLLPFYLIFGNWEDAHVWIAATQMVLDAVAVAILFKAVLDLTRSRAASWVAGILYCFYFFALGWAPVLYPEAPSLFFLILGFYFYVSAIRSREKSTFPVWLAFGLCWGIAALLRIQLLVLLVVPPLVALWDLLRFGNRRVLPLAAVYLGIALTYGLWPARNMIYYGEPVFIQKLVTGGVWSRDCTSFFDLLRAIKTDHQPQFSQLLKKKSIDWPEAIQWTEEEEKQIESAVSLMHECGRATQRWKSNEGFGEANIIETHCDEEVAAIWEELTVKVKSRHPFYTSFTVPIMNLSKCFFKNSLEQKSTPLVVRAAFAGRTLLILIGLSAALWMLFYGTRKESLVACLILLGFASIYLSLSFVARHIEMRYLLQADVLLLIPVAVVFGKFPFIKKRLGSKEPA